MTVVTCKAAQSAGRTRTGNRIKGGSMMWNKGLIALSLCLSASSCANVSHGANHSGVQRARKSTFVPVPILHEYPIPTKFSWPSGIALGRDGAIWFTESNTDKIGEITPRGRVSEFKLPKNSSPRAITLGLQGDMWFTESSGQADRIGSITNGGTITEYPSSGVYPEYITTGQNGDMWFTQTNGDVKGFIAQITPYGHVTNYPIPTMNSNPFGIAEGRNGVLWFTENSANQIGKINTVGTITEYPIPLPGSEPVGIALGPDGNMWFTESSSEANSIGSISPTGDIREYPIPTAHSSPDGITPGPQHSMWFTESTGNKVGKITMSGAITEYPLRSPKSSPEGIVAGRRHVWFAESGANKIGVFTVNARGSHPVSAAPVLSRRVKSRPTVLVLSDVTVYASPHIFCVEVGVKMRRAVAAVLHQTTNIIGPNGRFTLQAGAPIRVLGQVNQTCHTIAYGTSGSSGPYPLAEISIRPGGDDYPFLHGFVNEDELRYRHS